MGTNEITPEHRFWNKVNKTRGCWLWTGTTNLDGYGRFNPNGRLVGAHRFSYELAYGPIPEGMQVLHTCDTPNCVKPKHLWLGTHSDNMQDMYGKQRHGNKFMAECHPDRKHHCKGMCSICYSRQWHEAHPEKRRQYYYKNYHGVAE